MQEIKTITLMTGRSRTELEINAIRYILMKRNYAEIHLEWGEVVRARTTMAELEAVLGGDYIKVHRSCLVSAAQISRVGDQIILTSGERLRYAKRLKGDIVAQLCALRGCTPADILLHSPLPLGSKKTRQCKAEPLEKVAPPEPESPKEPQQMLEAELPEERSLAVMVNRRATLVNVDTILYVLVGKGRAEIHTLEGEIYHTRASLRLLEEALGDRFLKVTRACLVSVMSIHSVTKTVNLCNGESLPYPQNRRAELRRQLSARQKLFIDRLSDEGTPATPEEYQTHYRSFDNLPFAFTDIEMVFNEERHAVDWIFRYGNPALGRLEKMPLKRLIGNSFSSVFPNMDSKWLRSYEQAVLYGKTLEIIDYSPEIDTNLKIICFPTFKGHCGCILFDLDRIRLTENSAPQQTMADLHTISR